MYKVIKNIGLLVNIRKENKICIKDELANIDSLKNAFLIIKKDRIENWGEMKYFEKISLNYKIDKMIDANKACIMNMFVDSHTHLVFAGSREQEFVLKIKGKSYQEIVQNGGGINNTANAIHKISAEQLLAESIQKLHHLISLGTGGIEIKSGYGLNLKNELKILQTIAALKKISPIPIKSTFLGAHTIPIKYKKNPNEYINLIIDKMLPQIAKDNLADYIDVFCETGFYTPTQTEKICKAALKYGLKPRLHVNQLNNSGGVQIGAKLNAVSLDHLENIQQKEIQILSGKTGWDGFATILPTCSFFLNMKYAPIQKLIKAGAKIVLASDFNPGSSPSGNMNFVVALACIKMRILPEVAINASTINAAYSLGLENELGSISKGKKANLIFYKPIKDISYIPYSFGTNLIDKIMVNGNFIQSLT